MELVIKMPEEVLTITRRMGYLSHSFNDIIYRSIVGGTPLPKGHGRLIECDTVYNELIRIYRTDEKEYPESGKNYRIGLSNAIDLLNYATTIIEADKEEHNGNCN